MSRPENEDEGGFLGRWARRKQEVQKQEAQKLPLATEPTSPPAPAAESVELQPTDERPLPSLDNIVPGGDVSAFFQAHVPEALRTAALRKLWVTDPEIKNFIEMADYQWDFNNPDAIPGWSSSVGDFDAKRLIERIMGEEKELPKPLADGTTPYPKVEGASASDDERTAEEAAEYVSENTDSIDKSITSASNDTTVESQMIHNGAVQKTSEESIVYETVRKRHGGALPS